MYGRYTEYVIAIITVVSFPTVTCSMMIWNMVLQSTLLGVVPSHKKNTRCTTLWRRPKVIFSLIISVVFDVASIATRMQTPK